MRNLFLALLARGAAHGYELKRSYDELFAAVWAPINIGQVYATMGRLERDGLVVHRVIAQGDRPDKKVYELTELGRKALAAWFEESADPPPVKSDIVVKLLAARLSGTADPRALIAAQRARDLEALRAVVRLTPPSGGEGARVQAVLGEGAALHLDAELRWLARCEELLLDPHFDQADVDHVEPVEHFEHTKETNRDE